MILTRQASIVQFRQPSSIADCLPDTPGMAILRSAGSGFDGVEAPVHSAGVEPAYTRTQGRYLAFIYYAKP